MKDSGYFPIMKLDLFDAHDRFMWVQKQQSENISEVIRMFIEKDPFEGHPFYLFAHARKHEDGSSIRMIWQPRLTKPKAQTNSMLFKLYPDRDDQVIVIWIIPEREKWGVYEEGKMFANKVVMESIYDFQNNREKLEAREKDDLTDEKVREVLLKLFPNLFKEKL